MNARRPAIPSLTGVRFFAALAVVLHHANIMYVDHNYVSDNPILNGFRNILSYGNMGVPLFFLLSGFILAHNYMTTDGETTVRDNPKKFYGARFARLFPAFFLGFLIFIPNVIMHRYDRFDVDLTTILLFGGFLVLTLTHMYYPSHFTMTGLTSWNGPCWSLSVEVLFYALFPFFARYFYIRKLWAALLAITALMIGNEMWLSWARDWARSMSVQGQLVITDLEAGRWANLHPFTNILILFAGVTLYSIYNNPVTQENLGKWKADVIMIAILASTLFMGANHYFGWSFGSFRPFVIVLLGACLVLLCSPTSKIATLLSAPLFILLGESSYALYLTHGAIMSIPNRILDRFGITPITSMLVLLCLVVMVIASVCVYRFVEIPGRKFLLSLFNRRSAIQTS